MKRLLFIALTILICNSLLIAQEKNDSTNKTNDQISGLKGIKISGYLQMQYQKISTPGVSTIYGGNFPVNNDQRFMLRRSRLKAEYTDKLSKFAIQFAASEERISLDEVYITITEPWLKALTLKTGIFDRPFGFEVQYSSTKIEYDERSRVYKSALPNEKDMGFMIILQAPESSKIHFITLNAGVFNGTGPASKDFDNRKDFIGSIHLNLPNKAEILKVGLGFSYYKGGFDNQRTFHYEWNNGFKAVTNDSLAISENEYKGADVQVKARWLFGTLQLRAEYLQGTLSGTYSNNQMPSSAPADKSNRPLPSYTRSFNGGYILFIQDILDTKFQLVCKYDWFDPNTKVAGYDIGMHANTGTSDIKYSTTGFGFNYSCNEHIKFLTYIDIVKNETTSVTGNEKDTKDNILTFRLQYKF